MESTDKKIKIKVDKLRKCFGDLEVLKDISTEITEGEVVVILGPSGSGKSTFLRCLNRLEDATAGTIIVDDIDITAKKVNMNKVRENIGMVFQHFKLFNNMNVLDNLMLAPLELKKADKKEARARAEEMLKRVDLLEKADSYPSQLSGGQKQRVAIARALCMKPDIMLFDEPTSALDPETVKSILQLLKDINKKLGITIIMITHQMEVIKEIAERVAVIEHGRIIEEGSVVDLFTNPQTPTLKKFVGSVMSSEVPEQLSHMDIHADKENADDQTVLSLSFRGDVANEPIIANLIKKYNLDVSILYGSIDYIQNVSFGRLIITIIGDDSDMQEALSHLKSLPITSEVLGYVSSH